MFTQMISETNLLHNAVLCIVIIYLFEMAFFKGAMNNRQFGFNLTGVTALVISCLQGLDPLISLGGVLLALILNFADLFYISREKVVWLVMNIFEFAALMAIAITMVVKMFF